MNFYYPEKDAILVEVLGAYDFPATLLGAARYGQGHINDTFCVVCQPQEGDAVRYILQGLSLAAFPHPDELMENFIGITSYLRDKVIANGGDPLRETLSLVKTRDGKDYYTDSNGKVWRLTPFIENTDCFQSATPELFEASARSFGRFQYMLQGYPAETLHEAIVNFHNTEDRYAKFEAALAADKHDRAKDIQAEIQFVLDRKADCSVALQALRDGKLPLRVTHNDTKINNVLFHPETSDAMIVIDLDTVMPGLMGHDFGDAIRFAANFVEEDCPDLEKVGVNLEVFRAFAEGFLSRTAKTMTDMEVETLALSCFVLTAELATRFLADYLDGDLYFNIKSPDHNLVRTRCQIALAKDMLKHMDEMEQIVRDCVAAAK